MKLETLPSKWQNGSPEEGILFVRTQGIVTTLIQMPYIALGLILLALFPAQNSFSSNRALEFTIYQDGSTHILNQFDVDPLDPEFSTNIFGSTVENLITEDENGFLLSSEIKNNVILIETLGASTVSMEYDTHDLVLKNGKVWSFQVNSPVEFSLVMPPNAVIVGMNTYPLNLQVLDERSHILLQSGTVDISYFFGISGSAQTATEAIENGRSLIEQINNIGIETPLAQSKITESINAFEEGKFLDAEAFANEAKSLALEEQRIGLTNSETDNSIIFMIGIIALGGVLVITLVKRKKSSATQTTEPLLKQTVEISEKSLDKETIFKLRPNLREDDKLIVAFISDNGGKAYESELRKKFLQPRTTMWRAVKRLEREGVVEIDKKELQNLVRLTKKLEDEQ